LKQARHNTGLPCVGLKGTVVSAPHCEQLVRVSGRTLEPPRTRFALHCLQCRGSFVNCLSWKNSCSPAVNTNSAPQSLHVKTLSLNSMAGFPKEGKFIEIGHEHDQLAGPVSLLRALITTRARAATSAAANDAFSDDRETSITLSRDSRAKH
jgi:hypothetical protein